MKLIAEPARSLLRRGSESKPEGRRGGLSLEEELALAEVMDSSRALLLTTFLLGDGTRAELAKITLDPKRLRLRQGNSAEGSATELQALIAQGQALAAGAQGASLATREIEALRECALEFVVKAVIQEEYQVELTGRLRAELRGAKRGLARQLATLVTQGEETFKLARDRLVRENIPLARMLAAQVAGRGVAIDDLFQEACAGLLRAVDRYDYRRGLRFNTYAVWWIRSTLRLTVLERGRLVHVPLRQLQALNRLRRAEARYRHTHDGDPPLELLAEAAGVDLEAVEQLLSLPKGTTSLDVDDDDAKGGGWHERLTSADDTSPDDEADISRLQERVRAGLSELAERDALVVKLRFGIGCRPHTLAEVGKHLGVTRERARQLEARALERLRGTVAA